MTLEERKAKYRRDHGIPDDYEILTDAELAARRQAEQTTAVGAAYEGGLDVAASGAGGGLGYAGVKGLVSKLPLKKFPVFGVNLPNMDFILVAWLLAQ